MDSDQAIAEASSTFLALVDEIWKGPSPQALRAIANCASVFDIESAISQLQSATLQDSVRELEHLAIEYRNDSEFLRRLENRIRADLQRDADRREHTAHRQQTADEREAMKVDQDLINYYLAQLLFEDEEALFAGFGIIAKDLYQYLEELKTRDPEQAERLFRQAKPLLDSLEEAQADEAKFAESHGDVPAGTVQTAEAKPVEKPVQELLADPDVTIDLASSAKTGQADIKPLLSLRKQFGKRVEALAKAGQNILTNFSKKLKLNVCAPDGPYDEFVKGYKAQSQLPATVATTILSGCLTPATVWYPLAVWTGLLLVKSGLDVFCDDKPKKT